MVLWNQQNHNVKNWQRLKETYRSMCVMNSDAKFLNKTIVLVDWIVVVDWSQEHIKVVVDYT